MGKLFGTDGVRGVANTELTPELAFKLGKAGAYVLTKEKKEAARILVGMDTRISGDMLEAALTAGMCSVGAHVVCTGVIPTPGIAYLVRKYNMDAGVVISASHNPVKDNGIKFFSKDGYKLPDSLENEIEDIIFNKMDTLPQPVAGEVGSRKFMNTAVDDYADYLVSCMSGGNLQGMKIAVDCANGATYEAAPKVFEKLGAQLHCIHNTPDGVNINKDCGSTHMASLVEFVKNNKMDIGVAYDGDGDRCLVVDELGNIVDGDQIMSICAADMKTKGTLAKNTIVATVMSNLGFFHMGQREGINIEQTGVGDRYVLERLIEMGGNFGGEQSGHIIFLDHNTTGDGILTSINLIKVMKEKGKPLSELNTLMKVMPQVLVNAKVENSKKYEYKSNENIKSEIETLEKRFDGKGRVLIRPSGTEPLVRVMIEGENKDEIYNEARRIADLLEKELGC